MKENNPMIEHRLKRAVESCVPDVLAQLLLRIEREGDKEMIHQGIEENNAGQGIHERQMGRRTSWQLRLVAVALSLLFVFGGYLGYGNYFPQSAISIDVNPSIELVISSKEKVLKIHAWNEEAVRVLEDMNLKHVDLNVAINALIGSMVKHGYIDEMKNAILISVDTKDEQRASELQQRLMHDVSTLLEGFALEPAVAAQVMHEDERIQELADKHHVSLGKAFLIDRFVTSDPSLQYADIVALPINDIMLLIEERRISLQSVQLEGNASRLRFIGEERAQAIALVHAGVSETLLTKLEVEFDVEDGEMVYEVEFSTDAASYEYEIDARTGEILDVEVKRFSQGRTSTQAASQKPAETEKKETSTSSYIGFSEAERIALDHAGLSAASVRGLKSEFEIDDGRAEYEVEFSAEGVSYEYEIDARTGEILDVEIEYSSQGSVSTQAASQKPVETEKKETSTPSYIGFSEAERIALNHAGLSAASVRGLKSEFEIDDGRAEYEVEFLYGGFEYEYEIDAITGKILEWEKEIDD